MPRNDYWCEKHGKMELWFESNPPRECPRCGKPIAFLVSDEQFLAGGSWLTEPMKKEIHKQLGVYPRDLQHLKQIEKEKKVTAVTRGELLRSGNVKW